MQGQGMVYLLLDEFVGHREALMQTTKHIVISLAHFVRNILLLEGAMLVVVALLWRRTGWHTTVGYGTALATAGGTIIGVDLMGLAGSGMGSSEDTKLADAEMEMRSWDHKGQRRFTSVYTERTQTMGWLISLGIVTIGMGIVFNAFFP